MILRDLLRNSIPLWISVLRSKCSLPIATFASEFDNSRRQSDNSGGESENSRRQSDNSRRQSDNSRRQFENSGRQSENSRRQSENSRRQFDNSRRQSENSRRQFDNSRRQSENSGSRWKTSQRSISDWVKRNNVPYSKGTLFSSNSLICYIRVSLNIATEFQSCRVVHRSEPAVHRVSGLWHSEYPSRQEFGILARRSRRERVCRPPQK